MREQLAEQKKTRLIPLVFSLQSTPFPISFASTLDGIAFSAERKRTELSWILDQGRGESRAKTLFFGFSDEN